MFCFNNLFSIQPNLELAIEGCLVADHPQCISTKLSASLVCLVFCYFFDVVTVSLLGLLCTHMTAATVSKFLLVLHSKKATYLDGSLWNNIHFHFHCTNECSSTKNIPFVLTAPGFYFSSRLLNNISSFLWWCVFVIYFLVLVYLKVDLDKK